MTKKHFKALAAWLSEQDFGLETERILRERAESMADVLREFNPQFDKSRFVHYVMERYQRGIGN